MTEETKEEITIVLEILKKALIKNGVSIALKDNNICFFDTNEFIRTSMFDGFKVSIDDLVK